METKANSKRKLKTRFTPKEIGVDLHSHHRMYTRNQTDIINWFGSSIILSDNQKEWINLDTLMTVPRKYQINLKKSWHSRRRRNQIRAPDRTITHEIDGFIIAEKVYE